MTSAQLEGTAFEAVTIPPTQRNYPETTWNTYTAEPGSCHAGPLIHWLYWKLQVQLVKTRDEVLPGIPLMLGEGASYCADHRLRWEERSDAYGEVVEHAA